jgi:hypothetical protein
MRLRLPRTAAAMREVVARIDRAALAAGRRVTRPLAAAVLEDLPDAASEAGADSEADHREVFARGLRQPSSETVRLL